MGGHEGLAKALCGLPAVGRSATTGPVEKTVPGSGISHKALHGEREGVGGRVRKVYIQKGSGVITADSSGLPPACRGREKIQSHLLCVIVINLFMGACTSAHLHPITPCVVWWTTYHSIPSSRPVPFTAEVLKICHFLSLRAGRPRELATSVGVMACSMSCLFAKTIRMAFFSSSS